MPRFPKKEAEIVALANRMADGFLRNRPIYPQPPFRHMWLRVKTRYYLIYRDDLIAKQAAAEQATATKDEALEELIEAMKADVHYAENTVNFDDNKLKLIGWAGKKVATTLQPPGQARLLEAPKQGAGWLFLDWKVPAEGGKVGAYKVQRRSGESWDNIATAILTETTLVEQPEKTGLEFRVIAVNKSGEGQASNTVMVVL